MLAMFAFVASECTLHRIETRAHNTQEKGRMYGLRHGNFGRRKHIWSGFFDDVRVARLACSKACVSGSERIQHGSKGIHTRDQQ